MPGLQGRVASLFCAHVIIGMRMGADGSMDKSEARPQPALEDRQMPTILWTDNFEAACEQAGQDNKLVLLDFFSPT